MKSYTRSGFTLVELLLVLVVVAVLAAVALPSYFNQILKGNRSVAQQFMLDVATREQQILLDLRRYIAVSDTANFPNAPTAGSPGISLLVPKEANGNYTFVVTVDNAATPPTFTVTATAIGRQTVDGDLTLDQAGAKTPPSKW